MVLAALRLPWIHLAITLFPDVVSHHNKIHDVLAESFRQGLVPLCIINDVHVK